MAGRRDLGRDLFGRRCPSIYPHGEEADRIAFDLRRLSEAAHQIRLNQAALIIEVAAHIVELEGRVVQETEGQS